MAKQRRSLNSEVVAITGGARGIGRATAAALVAQGARVAIGDLDGEFTESVARELGDGVIGLQLDVTDRAGFSAFLDRVEHELGPLDVLVNNAGVQSVGDFAHEADAITGRTLSVNLGGCALGCKLALERMLQRDSGHIVNVASGLGRTAVPGGVSYCASKYAIVGLSEALRAELAGTDVEVHLVLPGFVDTEMSSGLKGLRGVRTLQPADVGAAVVEALQTGRAEIYVPRLLGPLIAIQPITPRPLAALIRRLLRTDRLLTKVDTLERAAYEARITPPERAPAPDRAATVANAAASVADALRAGDRERDHA